MADKENPQSSSQKKGGLENLKYIVVLEGPSDSGKTTTLEKLITLLGLKKEEVPTKKDSKDYQGYGVVNGKNVFVFTKGDSDKEIEDAFKKCSEAKAKIEEIKSKKKEGEDGVDIKDQCDKDIVDQDDKNTKNDDDIHIMVTALSTNDKDLRGFFETYATHEASKAFLVMVSKGQTEVDTMQAIENEYAAHCLKKVIDDLLSDPERISLKLL